MIKFVIKIGAVLVAGVLTYNYFFGDQDEKAQSQEVFSQIKSLGSSIGGLISSEKEKFDGGKYDEALAKVSSAVSNLKNRDSLTGGGMSAELAALETEKKSIESQLAAAMKSGAGGASPAEVGALYGQLQNLLRNMESVSQKMEAQEGASVR